MIVDRKYLLAEYKDGDKHDGSKSRGRRHNLIAKQQSIMSYASIFDTLWVRSELRQVK